MIDEQSAPPGTRVESLISIGTPPRLTKGHIYYVIRWIHTGDVVVTGDDALEYGFGASLFIVASKHPAAPFTPATLQNGWATFVPPGTAYYLSDVLPDATPSPEPKKSVPLCITCDIELCPDLDTYYGRDLRLKDLCSKCRKQYGTDAP